MFQRCKSNAAVPRAAEITTFREKQIYCSQAICLALIRTPRQYVPRRLPFLHQSGNYPRLRDHAFQHLSAGNFLLKRIMGTKQLVPKCSQAQGYGRAAHQIEQSTHTIRGQKVLQSEFRGNFCCQMPPQTKQTSSHILRVLSLVLQ